MKKRLNLVLLVALLITLFTGTVFAGTYSGGTGDPNDPYQIASVSDWNDLMHTSADWNKHFILTADVNLYGVTLTPVGNENESTYFTGVFDGNGHTISNSVINLPGSFCIGLFGYVYCGQIRNLGMVNVNITGGDSVGGLVGNNGGGTLTACYATGVVSGTSWVGGLVGCTSGGTLTACYATGVVSGTGYDVGGLVGISTGTITSCYATGVVSGAGYDVGGLVGANFGTLTSCYATSPVTGTNAFVGGLVGWNSGTLTACYATGSVSGTEQVGGLVGLNSSYGTLTDCYATGAVTGGPLSYGLVGYNNSGTVTACFWDIQTSGQTVGCWGPSTGVTGKTTAEMKQKATFTNWDFAKTWGIEDNQTYPFLRLTYPVGDLDLNKKVDFTDFAILANHWLQSSIVED
jgi:hypothetical protein